MYLSTKILKCYFHFLSYKVYPKVVKSITFLSSITWIVRNNEEGRDKAGNKGQEGQKDKESTQGHWNLGEPSPRQVLEAT